MVETKVTVAVGEVVPDFELPNQDGRLVKLSDYRGTRVVMFAFPKANTAGCTMQACNFRDEYPKIAAANAVVLGISMDSQEELKAWHGEKNLQYDLLSDPDKQVLDPWGAGDNSLFGLISRPFAKRSYWVIDAQGVLIDMQLGVAPKASVTKAMQALNR